MTNPTPHGQVPEALRLADLLRQQAAYHRETGSDCDMRAEDTINWGHGEVCDRAAAELLRLHTDNEALRTQQDDAYDHGPQAETVEEAARDVGKWLNERPNRPLDLRHVAMLTHHAKRTAHVQNPAEIEHVAGDVSKNGAELNTSTQQPAPAGATPECLTCNDHGAVGNILTADPTTCTNPCSFDGRAARAPAESVGRDAEDAARWRMLPAFFEEYQIDAMKLYRDIDSAMAANGGNK